MSRSKERGEGYAAGRHHAFYQPQHQGRRHEKRSQTSFIFINEDLPGIQWNYPISIKHNPQYGMVVNEKMLEIEDFFGFTQIIKENTRGLNVLDICFAKTLDFYSNINNQENNMADAIMGEPAVGPSDVIAGTISGGDITASGGDTSGIRTVNFTRTFVHYITNNDATWPTYDYDPHAVTGPSKLTMKHNCVEIPCQYLNCSMTIAELETHIVPSTAWRVVSSGFKVTNMIPIIDAVQGGADAAQMVYQISTRPYLIAYTDTKYTQLTQTRKTTEQKHDNKHTTHTTRWNTKTSSRHKTG